MIPMSLAEIAIAVGGTLKLRHPPEKVRRVVADSRAVRPGDLFIAIAGPRFDGHQFAGAAASRGAVACLVADDRADRVRADANRIIVQNTVQALGRLAAHHRKTVMPSTTRVVAITGSNGKTTTKFMLDHVLKTSLQGRAAIKSFNNHIGVPLTLLSARADDRYLLVEIGSNAVGEVAELAAMVAPDVGVITSIGGAHLEGFGSLTAIAAEKSSLLAHIQPDGAAFVNIDRPEILEFLDRFRPDRLTRFGFDARADLRVTDPRGSVAHTAFELGGRFQVDLPLPGYHHATNAAVVFAVARWFSIDPNEIIRRLATFSAAAGRARRAVIGDVTIIDDTYNANPDSMAAAIASLSRSQGGRRVLVMGDMLELGTRCRSEHHRIVTMAMNSPINKIVVVGAAMKQAVRACETRADRDRVRCFPSCAEAGPAVRADVRPNDTVWIKGSRALALEKIVALLREALTGPIEAAALS